VTSQYVRGFHGEDPDLTTQPWWLSSGEPSPGPADHEAARRDRAWRAAAAALAAWFVVLLPAAMTGAWIRGTVLSASGYVATVTPVTANPAVRARCRTPSPPRSRPRCAAPRRAENTLPPAAGVLAGPLSRGLADLAGNGISDLMASQAFQPPAAGGLNLVQLINEVLHDISGRVSALSGGAITVQPITAIPAAACHALTRTSSAACAQIPLFPAATLASARLVYRALTAATWLALLLTPLAFASALAVSPAHRRRRTLLQMTVGGTLTLLVTLTALSRLRSALISREAPRYQAVTSVIVHALTNGFFTLTAWFIAGGFALAAVTLLSGRLPPGRRDPDRAPHRRIAPGRGRGPDNRSLYLRLELTKARASLRGWS
jgi:hypothetical protein